MKNVKSATLSAVIIFSLSLLCFSATAPAADGESIIQDPRTGDYSITYLGSQKPRQLQHIIFVPATKITPTITSRFHGESMGPIKYRYAIYNGRGSKQPIDILRFRVSSTDAASVVAPKGWSRVVVANPDETFTRIGWSFDVSDNTADLEGLPPGRRESGFMLESQDIPGIGTAELQGATPLQGFPDDGPSASSLVGQQLNELTLHDFVPRPAAVPLIPVPNPFDASAVLTSMQKHVNQDLVTMNLIDPAFASQLDRLFQTAIAAAKGGNTVALKGNLKDLRQMLKREHIDVDKDDEDRDKEDDGKDKEKDKSRSIDKLAAKVLDFDLRYVEKRLKAGKDN